MKPKESINVKHENKIAIVVSLDNSAFVAVVN
jgi:hypothetical protein